MKIKRLRTINGPNLFHSRPVLEMTLDLENIKDTASDEIPGFIEALTAKLPGLVEHRCSPGYRGGFIERLNRGTYFAHIVEHIALELSTLADIEVGYGKSVYGGSDGVYKIVVRYRCEKGMSYLFRQAVAMAESLAKGADFDLAPVITEAKRLVRRNKLGPSTQAIVDAAIRKNIPWSRLNEQSLIQLGYGSKRTLIQATTTSKTSEIATDIAQDKDLTKALLEQASIPVPRGEITYSEAEALEAFENLAGSVVVKPYDGNHGRGISLNIDSPDKLKAAFMIAEERSSGIIVEEQLKGQDYRIFLVNSKLIAASLRHPANVIGNGTLTVHELIELENKNPLRGDGHDNVLTKITIDEEAQSFIDRNQIDLGSVPKHGEVVYLRETANLSTGGTAKDVTDIVHPEIKRMCERAARIVGLDVCGIDLIAEDITKPISVQKCGIIEVNAGPGIRMHEHPSEGKARAAGAAIVDHLFPNGSDGRIPIITITGTNGKTTVTRLIGHVVQHTGKTVGMTTSDGIHIGGEKIADGDTTGPGSAKTILSDPSVEVAVLETARGGIVKRGLGYDWSDVGIITNIQADHIGQDGIETIEDILKIKGLIAERVRPGGKIILNWDDPQLRNLATKPEFQDGSREIIYFSMSFSETLQAQVKTGAHVYFFSEGYICEAKGPRRTKLFMASRVPITFRGTASYQIANVLACVAAARTQGIEYGKILAALESFAGNEANAGRANLYTVNSGLLLVDFGHNPHAIENVANTVSQWPATRRTAVVAAPGDRDEEIIREVGRVAAVGFERVIIREDIDLRGREKAVSAKLLSEGLSLSGKTVLTETVLDPEESLDHAIRTMLPGEVVVYFYDSLDQVDRVLRQWNAQSVRDFSPSPGQSIDHSRNRVETSLLTEKRVAETHLQ